MVWQAYHLTFRMGSPLHSGYSKIGKIQHTRLYVTGRMLWGALTSRITRLLQRQEYAKVGEAVEKYLRTSYFFPCLDEKGRKPILPFMQEQQINYRFDSRTLKAPMVERWLITSYASTAIDTSRMAAEDGSLHEVELMSHRFLCDYSRDGLQIKAGDPVYLSGILFLADNAPCIIKKYWKQALEKLTAGGERVYGFGLLTLVDEPSSTHTLFGYPLTLSTPEPRVTVEKDLPILAHGVVEDGMDLEGIIEPFLGRETRSDGQFGKNLSKAQICWTPGVISREKKTFCVIEKGLWRIEP